MSRDDFPVYQPEHRRYSYWNGNAYELREGERWYGYCEEAIDSVTWVMTGEMTDEVVVFDPPL